MSRSCLGSPQPQRRQAGFLGGTGQAHMDLAPYTLLPEVGRPSAHLQASGRERVSWRRGADPGAIREVWCSSPEGPDGEDVQLSGLCSASDRLLLDWSAWGSQHVHSGAEGEYTGPQKGALTIEAVSVEPVTSGQRTEGTGTLESPSLTSHPAGPSLTHCLPITPGSLHLSGQHYTILGTPLLHVTSFIPCDITTRAILSSWDIMPTLCWASCLGQPKRSSISVSSIHWGARRGVGGVCVGGTAKGLSSALHLRRASKES